jgi:hypothetical protein
MILFLKPKTLNLKPNIGQALIESIVAIGALTIGLMGVLTLLSRAIGTNRVLSDSYIGTYLATEGVEVIKNDLDHNILLQRVNPATPWNAGICDVGTGGTASFQLQYDTTDLGAAYIGDASLNSTIKIKYDANRGYQYLSGAPTPFVRTVKVDCSADGSEGIAVSSVVTWITRGGATFSSGIEDHFYHYR